MKLRLVLLFIAAIALLIPLPEAKADCWSEDSDAVTRARVAPALSVRVVGTATLDGQRIARDIRWANATDVYIALGKNGVLQASLDLKTQALVVPPSAPGAVPISGQIGVGRHHLAVASAAGAFAYLPIDYDGLVTSRTFVSIMDVDMRGDRVALLGADRGDVQGLSRDGIIAWTGSVSGGVSEMRPLMTGRAKPGGKDMARCSFLETGAIRFMRDGSIVVAPGVEPGVFQYEAGGKLVRTWDTDALGFVDDCATDDRNLRVLAADLREREAWLGSRVILDEILPLRDGPALVLRHVTNGVSRWELVTLPASGSPQTQSLPITFPSPRAHVRGDARGDEIVLLLFDDPESFHDPIAPQQVIVLSTAR